MSTLAHFNMLVVLLMWVANVARCSLPAGDEQSVCPNQPQGHGPKVCSEERTSLLQTASVVQKRGTAAPHAPEAPGALVGVSGIGEKLVSLMPSLADIGGDDEEVLEDDAKEPAAYAKLGDGAAPEPQRQQRAVFEPSPPPPLPLVRLGQVLTVTAAGLLCLLGVLAMCGTVSCFLPRPRPLTRYDMEQLSSSWSLWLTICSYMAVQLMSTDQYIPNLAKIEADLGTTAEAMSMTLQVNWLLKGISALSMAYLADKFGRKPLFLLCTFLACVGSVSCACAPSIGWFMAGRVLQGIAEGVEPLFAMVARDIIDDPDERAAYTGAIFSMLILFPTISPVIGGTLASYMGWRVPFFALATWGFINIGLAAFCFTETKPIGTTDAASMESYREEFTRVLFDRHLVVLALVEGLATMLVLSVDTNFSLLLTHVFHQNQFEISLKLALLAAVLIPAGILPGALAKPLGTVNVLRAAMLFATVPIVGTFLTGLFAAQTWEPVFACISVCQVVAVCFQIPSFTLYYQPVKDVSGAASGISTCISMLLVVAGTAVSSRLVQESAYPTSVFLYWLAGTMVVIFILFWPAFGFNPPEWAMREYRQAEEAKEDARGKKSLGPVNCLAESSAKKASTPKCTPTCGVPKSFTDRRTSSPKRGSHALPFTKSGAPKSGA